MQQIISTTPLAAAGAAGVTAAFNTETALLAAVLEHQHQTQLLQGQQQQQLQWYQPQTKRNQLLGPFLPDLLHRQKVHCRPSNSVWTVHRANVIDCHTSLQQQQMKQQNAAYLKLCMPAHLKPIIAFSKPCTSLVFCFSLFAACHFSSFTSPDAGPLLLQQRNCWIQGWQAIFPWQKSV